MTVTPQQIFDDPTFAWDPYLQNHLHNASIVVSKLHPLFGWRLAMLMADLTQRGMASETPGKGTFQIYSGVRTQAHQIRLYNDICLAQKRCAMVANPWSKRGPDIEGIERLGSNHQTRKMPAPWSIDVGYAVDLYNERVTQDASSAQLDAAWAPAHDVMGTYGIGAPLDGKNGAPMERWHLQPQDVGWYSGAMAWPSEPGIVRPIMEGFIGGDVALLQEQIASGLGLKLIPRNQAGPTPDGAIRQDGHNGTSTTGLMKKLEAKIGRPVSGAWGRDDQTAYNGKPTAPAVAEPATPEPATLPADTDDIRNKLQAISAFQRNALGKTAELLDELERG